MTINITVPKDDLSLKPRITVIAVGGAGGLAADARASRRWGRGRVMPPPSGGTRASCQTLVAHNHVRPCVLRSRLPALRAYA